MTEDYGVAESRAAIERLRAGRAPRQGAAGRGAIRTLGQDELIGGDAGEEFEAEARRNGSARRLTDSAARPVETVIEVVDGWRLPALQVAQWTNLDRGRATCRRVLQRLGWDDDQTLDATYPASGVVRLRPRDHATSAKVELSRGRLQLSNGLVERAGVGSWPGVLVATDGDDAFLIDIQAASFAEGAGRRDQ
jgi:hypothetical protein